MRRLSLSNKKLRNIPRHLRALEYWASTFEGEFHPRPGMQRYWNWKIPVIDSLVQGPQARVEVLALCVQQLLEAARHLAEAADRSHGYYRVACLLVWPWLHQSEVTIFYDRDYYLSFLGQHNALAPLRLSDTLALALPDGFTEHGHPVIGDEGETQNWWCIGEPA